MVFIYPNCCQRQYITGSESLDLLGVDFCYIYLIKSKFNLIERNVISYLKQNVHPVFFCFFCCSQYTNITPYMIQAIFCISISINNKKTTNYLRFYACGSIQFNFAHIPDIINHLRVGIIKFDTCNIR